MVSSDTNSWLKWPNPNPGAKLRLFCFPYAGGGSTIFQSWPASLPTTIELCSVQLPGRGGRLLEPPFTRLENLVQTIAPLMKSYLDKPFAFFGHSMGALIAFELVRYLRRHYDSRISHLFVSGCRAPQLPGTRAPIHTLSDIKFKRELHRLNGTPKEVLEHPELLQLLLPSLRADFAICETYAYYADEPLACPITAFGGLQDLEVSHDELECWCEQTNNVFFLVMFPGDHFYINFTQQLLLLKIHQELRYLLAS